MRIFFTVTNDLSYDQRMHRICGTLVENGYEVTLVGRSLPRSIPLEVRAFGQKRLDCHFHKGFLFYAEYNLRLFFFLLFARYDAVCSVDLDTLAAGCLAGLIRRKKRVFDAHEYFTEVPEVVNRPLIKSIWSLVASICLPFYRHAYTVGPALAGIFEQKHKLPFGVVRNMPLRNVEVETEAESTNSARTPIVLYQGALNAGRGIETMLEAMQHLENVQFVLAGEGDLSEKLRQKSMDLGLQDKVVFMGYTKPEALRKLTLEAWVGLNLLENRGQSYYYSLANKFFDCVQAGVPVLTMDFPEYQALNTRFEVAVLLNELSTESVCTAIRRLQTDHDLYKQLSQNCLLAREEWNWECEQQTLLDIWRKVANE